MAINMLQNSAGTSRRAAFYNRLIYNILQYSISSYDNGRPDKYSDQVTKSEPLESLHQPTDESRGEHQKCYDVWSQKQCGIREWSQRLFLPHTVRQHIRTISQHHHTNQEGYECHPRHILPAKPRHLTTYMGGNINFCFGGGGGLFLESGIGYSF